MLIEEASITLSQRSHESEDDRKGVSLSGITMGAQDVDLLVMEAMTTADRSLILLKDCSISDARPYPN